MLEELGPIELGASWVLLGGGQMYPRPSAKNLSYRPVLYLRVVFSDSPGWSGVSRPLTRKPPVTSHQSSAPSQVSVSSHRLPRFLHSSTKAQVLACNTPYCTPRLPRPASVKLVSVGTQDYELQPPGTHAHTDQTCFHDTQTHIILTPPSAPDRLGLSHVLTRLSC